MNNIIIKFVGVGYEDKLQAKVKICSKCNFYYEGITYNGKINLFLESNCIYHLYAVSCGDVIDTIFYVDNNRSCYKFYFKRSIVSNVIFHLTDSNYQNLPIEKGELLLWQKQ